MRRSLWIWLFLVFAFGAGPAVAQSFWAGPPDSTTQVSAEWLKPTFEEGDGLSFFTSSFVMTAQGALSDRVRLVGDLPISVVRGEIEDRFGDEQSVSSTRVGNPYLGLEVRGRTSPLFVELGLRPPLRPNQDVFSSVIGAFTNLNRFSAFVHRRVPFLLVANYHYDPRRAPVSVRLRAGSELFLPAGADASGGQMLTYGLQGGYEGGPFEVGAGISGRWTITAPSASFRESSFHQVDVTLRGSEGRFRPGLLVRFFLEGDLREALRAVVGLTLTVSLSDAPGS